MTNVPPVLGLAAGGVLGYFLLGNVFGKGQQGHLIGAALGAAAGYFLLPQVQIPTWSTAALLNPSIRPTTIFS